MTDVLNENIISRFTIKRLICTETGEEFFTLWDTQKNKIHYNSHDKAFLTDSHAMAVKTWRNLNTRAKRGTLT
jgi:hypothetical protein